MQLVPVLVRIDGRLGMLCSDAAPTHRSNDLTERRREQKLNSIRGVISALLGDGYSDGVITNIVPGDSGILAVSFRSGGYLRLELDVSRSSIMSDDDQGEEAGEVMDFIVTPVYCVCGGSRPSLMRKRHVVEAPRAWLNAVIVLQSFTWSVVRDPAVLWLDPGHTVPRFPPRDYEPEASDYGKGDQPAYLDTMRQMHEWVKEQALGWANRRSPEEFVAKRVGMVYALYFPESVDVYFRYYENADRCLCTLVYRAQLMEGANIGAGLYSVDISDLNCLKNAVLSLHRFYCQDAGLL